MGVKELWSVLAPVMHSVPLTDLRGQTLAVDLSIWVVETQNVRQIQGVVTKPHLRNLFFRVNHLLQLGINLIFVIEGDAPQIKWDTMAQRSQVRYGGQGRGRGQRPVTHKPQRAQFKAITKECCQLLDEMGIPYVCSAGEAEAKCALLNAKGVVDGCLTDDGDAFLYGARRVYKNFTMNIKDPHVESYDMADVESRLGLTRRHLVGLAVLTGCDYLPRGVPGVGREHALKLFKYIGSDDVLKRFDVWVSNQAYYAELEAVASSKKPQHCSQCGHPGLARHHDKQGCVLCGSACHCDPQPYDYICSCEWHKKQALVGACSAELNIQKKAVSAPGFPWPKVLNEFLTTQDRIPQHSLPWKCPRLMPFIRLCESKLEWVRDYSRKKLVPLLTLWEMRELVADNGNHSAAHRTDTDSSKLTPHSIVKSRVKQGQACFELLWNKHKEDTDFAGSCYTTVEDASLVLSCFPQLVKQYQNEKALKAAARPTRRKAKAKPSDSDKENYDVIGLTEAMEDVSIAHMQEDGYDEDITSKMNNGSTDVVTDKMAAMVVEAQLGKGVNVPKEMGLRERLLMVQVAPNNSNVSMEALSSKKTLPSEALYSPSKLEEHKNIGKLLPQRLQTQQIMHVESESSSAENDEPILPLCQRLELMRNHSKKTLVVKDKSDIKDLVDNMTFIDLTVNQIQNDTITKESCTDVNISQGATDIAGTTCLSDDAISSKSFDISSHLSEVPISQQSNINDIVKQQYSNSIANLKVLAKDGKAVEIIPSEPRDSLSKFNRKETCSSEQKITKEMSENKTIHSKSEIRPQDIVHSALYINDSVKVKKAEVVDSNAVSKQLGYVNKDSDHSQVEDEDTAKLKSPVTLKGDSPATVVNISDREFVLKPVKMLSSLVLTHTQCDSTLNEPQLSRKSVLKRVIKKQRNKLVATKESLSQQSSRKRNTKILANSHNKSELSCKTKKVAGQMVKKSSKPWYKKEALSFSSDDDFASDLQEEPRGRSTKACMPQVCPELHGVVKEVGCVPSKNRRNSMQCIDVGTINMHCNEAGKDKRAARDIKGKAVCSQYNERDEGLETGTSNKCSSTLNNDNAMCSEVVTTPELNCNGDQSLSEHMNCSTDFQLEGGFIREDSIKSGHGQVQTEGSGNSCYLQGGFFPESPNVPYVKNNKIKKVAGQKVKKSSKPWYEEDILSFSSDDDHLFDFKDHRNQGGTGKEVTIQAYPELHGDVKEVRCIQSKNGGSRMQWHHVGNTTMCSNQAVAQDNAISECFEVADGGKSCSKVDYDSTIFSKLDITPAEYSASLLSSGTLPQRSFGGQIASAKSTVGVSHENVSISSNTPSCEHTLKGMLRGQTIFSHYTPEIEQARNMLPTSASCSTWNETQCGDFSLGCTLLDMTFESELGSPSTSAIGNDDLLMVSPPMSKIAGDDLTIVDPSVTSTGNDDLTVVYPSTSPKVNDDVTVVYPCTSPKGNDDVTVVYPCTSPKGNDDVTVVYPCTSPKGNGDVTVVYPCTSPKGNDDVTVVYPCTSPKGNDDVTVVYPCTSPKGNDDVTVVLSMYLP